LVWEAQKAATTISEGVNEMGRIVANTTLNLCFGILQEVGEVEATLAEDKIAYRGSVGDAGMSTSTPSASMSDPGPSTS
jgi:hypothetical protein